MPSMIIIFHTASNAGYAMAPLERMFYDVACAICGDKSRVHFGFSSLISGMPRSLPDDFENVIEVDSSQSERSSFESAKQYIEKANVDIALCFDIQPDSVLCKVLREGGVKKVILYWGSTMSSLNSGPKLWLKKLQVFLLSGRPNLFIFESSSMQHYATHGRGIPLGETTVIPTGVDTDRFKPDSKGKTFLFSEFGIQPESFVCFYSGHMEERKGVHVIMQMAIELVQNRKIDNVYFIICGNRPGEETVFLDMLSASPAKDKVIFAGYRTNVNEIISGSDLGVIASTGWDSFPMSSLEMASGGLPIVVSALQGLVETLEDGVTGYTFEPGNAVEAADHIEKLINNDVLYKKMSEAARARILASYSLHHQKASLIEKIQHIL